MRMHIVYKCILGKSLCLKLPMNQDKIHCGFTSQVNLSCFNDVSVKYWLRIVFLLFVVLYMYLVFYMCLRCIHECE